MEEIKKVCSNCKYWLYNQQIEKFYGMGVGLCRLNGCQVFCDSNNCSMHSLNKEF